MAEICAAKFRESFHGFATAHRDHAPPRSGVSAERRNWWEPQPAALCRDAATKRRFMGSEHLQNTDVKRSHEPDRNPSPCPLPARRGEGGRRPGEGRFMDRLEQSPGVLTIP